MIIEIPLLCTIIALLACLYASYTDLKLGIIPNKLTFPLIGLGIVLNVFYAFLIGNIWLMVYALIFTAGTFVLGYILWRLGAWAGGDVKLFTALAALLPFYPQIVNYNLLGIQFPINATYPFPLTLIINSILAILPFLLIFIFYIVLKKKPYLMDELIAPLKNYKKNIVLTLVITSAGALTLVITPYLPYQLILISLILIYLLTFVISKMPNRVKAVVVSVLIVFALYKSVYLTIIGVIVLFLALNVIELIKSLLTTVNKKALQDDYEINDLKEGMIPAYNMYKKDDEIYFDKKGFFDKIKESIKEGNVLKLSEPKGELLISNMAAGLSKEDIEVLKKLLNEDKISNKLKIKKGVPFAPSIFIGLLISLFIGDLAIILQKVLSFLFT
ncbi:MAG TPA: A24 family peptidase C-terminal domain-containing protein [Methanobacterium sp.]|nr:A24 family peptidase C-terminal domain-containing protein [Methanobacterium sp.]